MRNLYLVVILIAVSWLSAAPVTGKTIPVDVWADTAVVSNVSMSDDGKHIAMLQRKKRGAYYNVVTFDTANPGKTLKNLDTGKKLQPLSLFWVGNDHLVIYFIREEKKANDKIAVPRILSFNVKTNKATPLLDSKTVSKRGGGAAARMAAIGNGGISSRLDGDPKHIIMWFSEGSNQNTNYYKVNVETGVRTPILKGNTRYGGFGFDWDGEARTATTYDPNGPRVVSVARIKGQTDWIEVGALDARKRQRFSFLGFYDEKRPNVALVSMDTPGGNNQKIYEIDIRRPNSKKELFSETGLDTLGALVSARPADRQKLVGFTYAGKFKRERYYFDQEVGALYASIEKSFPNNNVSFSKVSDDKKTILFNVSGPRIPGDYYMIKNGVAAKIASIEPDIKSKDLAHTKGVSVKARDGREVQVLVTTPQGAGPFPGIVMPHGGPWVRDYFGYDSWAQMLANRGYVVVQPNYRGSTGLGLDHWLAGDNQWGLAMQNDMEDAILHFTKNGLVDKSKLGFFGWSYGGYAAFVAATRDNSIFNCSVAGAGISDIGKIRGGLSGSRYLRKYQQPTITGASALQKIDNVKMPMLIVHGNLDVTVPVDQSRWFVKAAKKKKLDVKYVEIKGMRHSPLKYEQNMQWYPELFDFFENKCKF